MRPTSAPRRFARLLPLVVACAVFGAVACGGDNDDTAPTTSIQNFMVDGVNVNPSGSPIALTKAEQQLRMTVRFNDNDELRGHTIRMAPEFTTSNMSDQLFTFTQQADTFTTTSRTLNVSLNGTTATMTTGTFRLTVTCRDAAGNVSAEAVQRFSVN